MENIFKRLKVTNYDGVVNYMPFNKINLDFHKGRKARILDKSKREKYLVEEVNLTIDEAVELGISEAIQVKYPPAKRKQQTDNSDVVAMLLAQNAKLMGMLEDKKQSKTK